MKMKRMMMDGRHKIPNNKLSMERVFWFWSLSISLSDFPLSTCHLSSPILVNVRYLSPSLCLSFSFLFSESISIRRFVCLTYIAGQTHAQTSLDSRHHPLRRHYYLRQKKVKEVSKNYLVVKNLSYTFKVLFSCEFHPHLKKSRNDKLLRHRTNFIGFHGSLLVLFKDVYNFSYFQ